MINAAHLLMHSTDAPADRAFLRDVLQWAHVEDAGSEPGWLIFALPPTELGVHPTDGDPQVTLHLMCDALQPTLEQLAERGVRHRHHTHVAQRSGRRALRTAPREPARSLTAALPGCRYPAAAEEPSAEAFPAGPTRLREAFRRAAS